VQIPKIEIPKIKFAKIKMPIQIFGIKTSLILLIFGILLNIINFCIIIFAFILMTSMLLTPTLGISGLIQEGINVSVEDNNAAVVLSFPLKFINFLPIINEIKLNLKSEMASGYEIKTMIDLNEEIILMPFESKDLNLSKSYDINKFLEFQESSNTKLSGNIYERNLLSNLEISFEIVQDLNKEGLQNEG